MTEEQLDLRAGARLILRELRKQWTPLSIALTCALLWSGARIAVPTLTGQTIDRAIGDERLGLLAALVTVVLALAVAQGLAAALRRYTAFRTSYRVEADLRAALYNRVNRLSFDYHDRTSTGQLMSRGSTDLHEVQQFVVTVPISTAWFMMAVGAFAVALFIHPLLAASGMLVYPIVTVITIRFFNRLFPATARIQQGLGELAGVVEENVSGARLVRAFGREQHQIEKLGATADTIYDDSMEAAWLRTIYTPLFFLLPALGQLVVLSYGGWLVLEGAVSIGEFVTFVFLLNLLVWPVQGLGEIVASGQRAVTSAARVWNVLKEEPAVREPAHPEPVAKEQGDVVFDHVSFGYQARQPILQDFSLHIAAGTSVALVGPTGCGKTTVAQLLPRFYDIEDGSITMDGVDVRGVKLEQLRQNVGLVFEDTMLFSDSIRNNIAYGRLDASDEAIEEAARLAQASEFIDRLPDGYETVVGEQGYSLSGGQRQRIAIARAVLMQPRVLILDDATSSVDARMEEEIRNALRRVMDGRTTIIISHRLATIALADSVVLMDGGRIVGSGTHKEMLANSSRYAEVLGRVPAAS